jgi:hypothetical protein
LPGSSCWPRLDYFRELKVLGFGVVASVVLNEWCRCYCIVIVVVLRHVRVFEHHAVVGLEQVFITDTARLLLEVRRVRDRSASVVHRDGLVVAVGERGCTCCHSRLRLETFAKAQLVEEREALVKLALELLLKEANGRIFR